jgi:hypothetical protein
VIENNPYTDIECKFNCVGNYQDVHKQIPSKIIATGDSSTNKTLTIAVGYCNNYNLTKMDSKVTKVKFDAENTSLPIWQYSAADYRVYLMSKSYNPVGDSLAGKFLRVVGDETNLYKIMQNTVQVTLPGTTLKGINVILDRLVNSIDPNKTVKFGTTSGDNDDGDITDSGYYRVNPSNAKLFDHAEIVDVLT